MDSEEKDILGDVIRVLEEKIAEDIVVLDVKDSGFTDYFVIATIKNPLQASAIIEGIDKLNLAYFKVEGSPSSSWILVDLGDIIVHLFTPEAREFYDLELLWGKSERVVL